LPMGWSNRHAKNMEFMDITLAVFHVPMGDMNAFAQKNMDIMDVTLAVFQDPMGWLNAWALLNIMVMSVTLAVFQLPMGWLNSEAANMACMVVTLDVSHEAMVPLNADAGDASLNRRLIFVTRVVTMLLKGTKFPALVK
jgi:hypothetical protein